jgi:hypothetical protein
MSPRRLYFGLIGLLCLLFIGLLISVSGINSMFSSRATTLTSLKAKNAALNQEQAGLAVAKEQIKKYAGVQQIAQAVVPEDKDQAEAIREIVNIAAANHVQLSTINFPASSLGSTAGDSTSSSSGSSTAPVTIGKVKINPQTGNLSQLQPVKNIPGVYVLQLTVQSDANNPVSYNSFINFLTALEYNRRTAQITSITLEPNQDNPNLLSFSLIINEYIKP